MRTRLSTEEAAKAGSRFREAVFPRIPGRAGRSAELERESEAARVRGYAAGHAEGMRIAAETAVLLREEAELAAEAQRIAAERRITHALVAVEEAALSLAERERALAAAGGRELERLALELAEAVLGRELSTHPEVSARAALERALAGVDDAEPREVRLHPADLSLLHEAGAAPEGVVLVADAALSPGDAVAIVADGSVDARIRAAFDRARAALEDAS